MDFSIDSPLFSIWELVEPVMRKNFSASELIYNLWFGRMNIARADSESVVFVVENELKRKTIDQKYKIFLADCLEEVLGYRPDVSIDVDESLAPVVPDDGSMTPLKIVRQHQAERAAAEKEAAEKAAARRASHDPSAPRERNTDPAQTEREELIGQYESAYDEPLDSVKYAASPAMADAESDGFATEPTDRRLTYNADYTFENFVVGNSNKFAFACAENVANNVGMWNNPLFIWGPTGLGKTHLMYAIANRALKRDPKMKVIYVKGEEFMNQLIEAIQHNRNYQFRQKYRSADMLLIDDIQFIAGKESTQMEFFHTFEALYEDHKQIILTSDRPPKDLPLLEDRIRSRFEAGLLVDIQPPEYELRLAILQAKIKQNQIELPTEVIRFLAQNLQENIRQLEGVIKKLATVSLLTGQSVNMDMVLSTVPEYLRDAEPVSDTVRRIIETTAQQYGVTAEDIYGQSRKKEIKNARNAAMYVVRTVTELSLPQIGAYFKRDHSTVHSNISAIEVEIASDAITQEKINQIIKEIKH